VLCGCPMGVAVSYERGTPVRVLSLCMVECGVEVTKPKFSYRGTYGGPREWAFSYERGTLVLPRQSGCGGSHLVVQARNPRPTFGV